MNERIRELEMQVARSFDPLKDWDCSEQEYAAEFNRRFAELIVRECAEVIFETPVKYTEIDIMHIIRDRVKEHFGVE